MLKRIGQKLHQSCLKCITTIIINAVRTVKIIYKKAGIKTNIKRIIIANKSSFFLTTHAVLNTSVKEELLITLQNTKQSFKVFFKSIKSKNNKNVRVFFVFNFLHYRRIWNNSNYSTIMKPRVCMNGSKNTVGIHIFRSVIKYLDFRQFIINNT